MISRCLLLLPPSTRFLCPDPVPERGSRGGSARSSSHQSLKKGTFRFPSFPPRSGGRCPITMRSNFFSLSQKRGSDVDPFSHCLLLSLPIQCPQQGKRCLPSPRASGEVLQAPGPARVLSHGKLCSRTTSPRSPLSIPGASLPPVGYFLLFSPLLRAFSHFLQEVGGDRTTAAPTSPASPAPASSTFAGAGGVTGTWGVSG